MSSRKVWVMVTLIMMSVLSLGAAGDKAEKLCNVKIGLESLSLNHDSNSSSADAINIRMNYTADVHVPEWKKGESPYPAAYIINLSITVQAVFSAPAWVTSAKIRAFTVTGGLGNILPETVLFNNGMSAPVSFQVSGYTPNKITSFQQIWLWTVQEINGVRFPGLPFGTSMNKIFVILALPQTPWTTDGQTEPWVEALEKACNWAKNEKTPEGAAKKITKYLFKNVGGLYDTDWGAPYYPWSWTDFSKFALTNFLENIPNVGVVNCYDMGKSLVTISNTLGCGLSYRYSNPFGYVNCINAIGRGWTNNPFYTNPEPSYNIDRNPIVPGDWSWDEGRSYFGNHAFGTIGEMVFDACLTVDTDNDPDDGPSFKETWLIDVSWESYGIKVVDDYPLMLGGPGFPESPTFEIY